MYVPVGIDWKRKYLNKEYYTDYVVHENCNLFFLYSLRLYMVPVIVIFPAPQM